MKDTALDPFQRPVLAFWHGTGFRLWIDGTAPPGMFRDSLPVGPNGEPMQAVLMAESELTAAVFILDGKPRRVVAFTPASCALLFESPEGLAALLWRALAELDSNPAPAPYCFALAEYALKQTKQPIDAPLRNRLGVAIHEVLSSLRLELAGQVHSPPSWWKETGQDGVLELDKRFCRSLARHFGDSGRAFGEAYMRDLRERIAAAKDPELAAWSGWVDPDAGGSWSRALGYMAYLVWTARVSPAVSDEATRDKASVVYMHRGVVMPLQDVQARGTNLNLFDPERLEQRSKVPAESVDTSAELVSADGRTVAEVTRDGRVVAEIASVPGFTLDAIIRGSRALGTVAGHRLVRAVVTQVHENLRRVKARERGLIMAAADRPDEAAELARNAAQEIDLGLNDPGWVVFPGGWRGFRETLRIPENPKGVRLGKDLVTAGHALRFSGRGYQVSGLWTSISLKRGSRHRPGFLALYAGACFMPRFVNALPPDVRAVRWRVPELRHEPPVSTLNSKQQGPAWNLARLVMLELVEKAPQLLADGAVVISEPRWAQLGEVARVANKQALECILERFTAGDDDAPPFLVRDGDRWTLASPHRAEQEYILDGARTRAARQATTRKSRAKRGRK